MRPKPTDFPQYYQRYIDKIPQDDVVAALTEQYKSMKDFLTKIAEHKGDHAYAEGKWTVKQLLQHVIDAERVFAYRAMWIARKAPDALPGFEEDDFAREAPVSARTVQQLAEEILAVRAATIPLFEGFTAELLNRSGIANKQPIVVNAIGFIIAGHWEHHKTILTERYGI